MPGTLSRTWSSRKRRRGKSPKWTAAAKGAEATYRRHGIRRLCLVSLALLASHPALASPLKWRELSPGVDYAVTVLPSASAEGASLHVVRIDPSVATIRFVSAACTRSEPRTAGDWCRDQGLSVAINLGMYQEDVRSNVGYARGTACVNNNRWSSSYKSALVFEPKRKGIP